MIDDRKSAICIDQEAAWEWDRLCLEKELLVKFLESADLFHIGDAPCMGERQSRQKLFYLSWGGCVFTRGIDRNGDDLDTSLDLRCFRGEGSEVHTMWPTD